MRKSEWLFERSEHRQVLPSVRYTPSARIYATSDTSFEDVTLKFFALRDKEPLREYLLAVLKFQQPAKVKTTISRHSTERRCLGQHTNHYPHAVVNRSVPERIG